MSYDYCLQVSKYMVHFARKTKFEQQMTVIDWIRYAGLDQKKHCRFLVPAIRSQEEYRTLLLEPDINNGIIEFTSVCNFALMTILGYGLKFWRTCSQHALEWTTPEHGLSERSSNNAISEEVQMELHLFFADVELHAEPTPMRFIREKTGQLLERDKTDVSLLPPYFTKRSLYRRYCFEQGWRTTTTCTGSPNKPEKRNDDEWKLIGREHNEVIGWASFLRFWANNYPALKVGKPSEDVCNACHKYCNQLKFNQLAKDGDVSDDESVNNSINDEAGEHGEQEGDAKLGADASNYSPLLAVPIEVQRTEAILAEADQHVKDAKIMREYANEKMKEARAAKSVDVPWDQQKDCLVADYCQNMALPYLGMTQPGETYYFSPLTVQCFGTADASIEPAQMRAYVYHEGEGKKGGNNVTSLLYKDLVDRKWIDKDQGPREELTIIMDNCGGQNKNKMVLRMLLFLVERRLYKRVNACFLVAGHTKNVCDRLFNLLKLTYRANNIYVFPQLMEALNTAEDVAAVRVLPDDFYDWDDFENKLYRQITTGTVNRTHLFQYDERKPGIITTRDTAAPNSHSHEQQLRNRMDLKSREHLLKTFEMQLKQLQPPGIKPIKQWELWHKWRSFIPPQYQDELCPRPSEVVAQSMQERSREAGRKAAEKKRVAKKQRQGSMVHTTESNEGNSQGSAEGSTQMEKNTSQANEVSHTMNTPDVTRRLNPASPS